MLRLLLNIWAMPGTKDLIRLILSAALGGFAASEIHSPKMTASWMPDFFGDPTNQSDPVAAIGRLAMGNTGCTGTITGPIGRRDERIRILTAAHCIKVGQTGTMALKDGRTFPFKCVSRDPLSDCAWLIADRPKGKIPFARMAFAPPTVDSPVWHQGYGIDKPNNREAGRYLGQAANGSQLRYRMSVSPGDSGGGIITTASGEILSPVCCTTRLSGLGDVFGAHPAKCSLIRPDALQNVSHDEPETDLPLIHPVIPLPSAGWPDPQN